MKYKLNRKQQKELDRIQAQMLTDANKQVRLFERKLQAEVKVITKRLQKTGYSKRAINTQVKALLTRNKKLLKQITERMTKDAEKYSQRFLKKLASYDVKTMTPIPASKLKYLKATRGNVRAALAYAKERASIPLSRALHRVTVGQTRQAALQVNRAIREAQSLQNASRDLVKAIKGVGAKEKLPKLVKRTLKQTKKLDRVTGGLLKPEVKKLSSYLKKLKPGGRMRGAYIELVDDLQKNKAGNAAIDKWVYQKQRYNAERIIKTETQAAFRRAQINASIGKPWVVGYIWHLNRGGGTHTPCVCDTMDGTVVPADKAEQWLYGAHPFCNCTFEQVVDMPTLRKTGITDSERIWLATNR